MKTLTDKIMAVVIAVFILIVAAISIYSQMDSYRDCRIDSSVIYCLIVNA